MLQRLIRLLAALSVMILTGSAAVGQEPRRLDQETFISRAAFADGQLWLLPVAGVLWGIAEGKDEPVTIDLPEPALDLWIEDGQPAVATCDRNNWPWTIGGANGTRRDARSGSIARPVGCGSTALAPRRCASIAHRWRWRRSSSDGDRMRRATCCAAALAVPSADTKARLAAS